MVLVCPPIAEAASPGQFVHVAVAGAGSTDPLLRRPMSVSDADISQGDVTLVFRVAGRGTRALAQKRVGEMVSLMGPIGHGFTFGAQGRQPLLVAGGMGIAPLFFLSKSLRAAGFTPRVLAGFGTGRDVILTDDLRGHGAAVCVVTEDGAEGMTGRVTDHIDWAAQQMRECMPGDEVEMYACGPMPMLRAVQAWCLRSGVPGQVSLESRMACGTGACLGCAQRVADSGAEEHYERVCQEGPVFDVRTVVLSND
jgi:dihydroorotate dehydrogenase electron transfer subunit